MSHQRIITSTLWRGSITAALDLRIAQRPVDSSRELHCMIRVPVLSCALIKGNYYLVFNNNQICLLRLINNQICLHPERVTLNGRFSLISDSFFFLLLSFFFFKF